MISVIMLYKFQIQNIIESRKRQKRKKTGDLTVQINKN